MLKPLPTVLQELRVHLTILRSISATSNKNAHLNKEKAVFLIKAQRMTDLYPKTTFNYPPLRGFTVAIFKRRFCLL